MKLNVWIIGLVLLAILFSGCSSDTYLFRTDVTNISLVNGTYINNVTNVSNYITYNVTNTTDVFNITNVTNITVNNISVTNQTVYNVTNVTNNTFYGGNESWNESYANTLYYSVLNPQNYINLSNLTNVYQNITELNNSLHYLNLTVLALNVSNNSVYVLIGSINSTLNVAMINISSLNNSLAFVNVTLNQVMVNQSIINSSIKYLNQTVLALNVSNTSVNLTTAYVYTTLGQLAQNETSTNMTLNNLRNNVSRLEGSNVTTNTTLTNLIANFTTEHVMLIATNATGGYLVTTLNVVMINQSIINASLNYLNLTVLSLNQSNLSLNLTVTNLLTNFTALYIQEQSINATAGYTRNVLGELAGNVSNNYYLKSNPYNFINLSNVSNVTTDQIRGLGYNTTIDCGALGLTGFTNVTANCTAFLTTEVDPIYAGQREEIFTNISLLNYSQSGLNSSHVALQNTVGELARNYSVLNASATNLNTTIWQVSANGTTTNRTVTTYNLNQNIGTHGQPQFDSLLLTDILYDSAFGIRLETASNHTSVSILYLGLPNSQDVLLNVTGNTTLSGTNTGDDPSANVTAGNAWTKSTATNLSLVFLQSNVSRLEGSNVTTNTTLTNLIANYTTDNQKLTYTNNTAGYVYSNYVPKSGAIFTSNLTVNSATQYSIRTTGGIYVKKPSGLGIQGENDNVFIIKNTDNLALGSRELSIGLPAANILLNITGNSVLSGTNTGDDPSANATAGTAYTLATAALPSASFTNTSLEGLGAITFEHNCTAGQVLQGINNQTMTCVTPTATVSSLYNSSYYSAKAYQGGANTLGNAWPTMNFSTPMFDNASMRSAVDNSRFIAPINGKYWASCNLQTATNSVFGARLIRNGDTTNPIASQKQGNSGATEQVQVSGIVDLIAGDYVQCQGYATSTYSTSGNINSHMSMYRLPG